MTAGIPKIMTIKPFSVEYTLKVCTPLKYTNSNVSSQGKGESIIEVEFVFYELRYFWKELNLCMIKAFHCKATSSVWHYDFFTNWKKKKPEKPKSDLF